MIGRLPNEYKNIIFSISRLGFTLVEIVIASAIIMTSMLMVLMAIPSILEAQKTSEFRVRAAVQALDIATKVYQHDVSMDTMQSPPIPNLGTMDPELERDKVLAEIYSQNPFMGPAGRPDVERILMNPTSGYYPLPTEIARRLDSPNDEIQRILDQGRYMVW